MSFYQDSSEDLLKNFDEDIIKRCELIRKNADEMIKQLQYSFIQSLESLPPEIKSMPLSKYLTHDFNSSKTFSNQKLQQINNNKKPKTDKTHFHNQQKMLNNSSTHANLRKNQNLATSTIQNENNNVEQTQLIKGTKSTNTQNRNISKTGMHLQPIHKSKVVPRKSRLHI